MSGVIKDSSSTACNILKAKRIGIETLHEMDIFLRQDSHVCRAEGFSAHGRILVTYKGQSIVANLYQVNNGMLHHNEAGFSESAWNRLGLSDGDDIIVNHAPPTDSLSFVRGKVYGQRLDEKSLQSIVGDIAAGRYSNIELSAFITACAARPLDDAETNALTHAMIAAGDRVVWNKEIIVDKHCVGGLPGNRTTPIVVAIVAACGLTIPKTSSRAITSPAGTADAMETLAPVALDEAAMRRVVEQEGGCVVWGGSVHLSPTDDILIRVERVLDLDGEGQLVASILSKKIAAGATHLVLDLPVGPTAKVRSRQAAEKLSQSLVAVGQSFGLCTKVILTDGTQPVGRGIGPALEAYDVLNVLQGTSNAPQDLRDRAVTLSGYLLELGGAAGAGEGYTLAMAALADGRAWTKFQRICEAQGGMRIPPRASHHHVVAAASSGHVREIDNRRLSKVAKLAGAPADKAAGVILHTRIGQMVERGEPLYTVHAESPGELAYALAYAKSNPRIVGLDI